MSGLHRRRCWRLQVVQFEIADVKYRGARASIKQDSHAVRPLRESNDGGELSHYPWMALVPKLRQSHAIADYKLAQRCGQRYHPQSLQVQLAPQPREGFDFHQIGGSIRYCPARSTDEQGRRLAETCLALLCQQIPSPRLRAASSRLQFQCEISAGTVSVSNMPRVTPPRIASRILE